MSEQRNIPGSWQVIRAVGTVTFREIIRDKVLYNVVFAGVILFAVSFLASRLATLQPGRVLLDFGISALSISSLMIGVLTGAGMLSREFDRRTAYVALSHPITRMQFVLGKYFGLATVVGVNWLLLVTLYLLMLWGQTGSFMDWVASPTWISAVFLTLLQGLFMASITVLFSTFTTTSLSVIMTLGIYLIGSNNTELRQAALKMESPLGRHLLEISASLLPNLEHFNLGFKVTYGLPVSAGFMAGALAYGLFYTAFCLTAAGFLIRGRES